MRIKPLIIVIFTSLIQLANSFAQSQEIEITCAFDKKGYPIQKKLFRNMELKVSWSISNISDENLIIPDYKPFFIILDASGDTLKCNLNNPKFIPIPSRFEQITFVKIPSHSTIRGTTDILLGCDFNFEYGKEYKIIAEFRSVYSGVIDIDGESVKIWKGTVRSKPIVFKFKD